MSEKVQSCISKRKRFEFEMARFYCTAVLSDLLIFLALFFRILHFMSLSGFTIWFKKTISLNPFTPKSDSIDFTLSNARRFYSSKGDPSGVKGLKNWVTIFSLNSALVSTLGSQII